MAVEILLRGGENMKKVIKIALWIWQLPQNLIGLIAVGLFSKGYLFCNEVPGEVFHLWNIKTGSISLGEYRLVCSAHKTSDETYKHEYGHTIQSRILGPLWLIVIGLPSIIWAAVWSKLYNKYRVKYSWFYTESWANKLTGAKID